MLKLKLKRKLKLMLMLKLKLKLCESSSFEQQQLNRAGFVAHQCGW